MDQHADLAIGKQAFQSLMAICPPEDVLSWQPTAEQRANYIRLAERALDAIESLEALERRNLLEEGQIASVIPSSLLSFLRVQIRPHVSAIRAAVDHLDPEGIPVRDLLNQLIHSGGGGRVRATFEEGLQQLSQLLERNPGWGEDHGFLPESAYQLFDSKLVQFEPDAWLDRARELLPIRTDKNNLVLPMHVRLRLEELYRSYVFGLWLSVFGLSRAILEYAILDNLAKFDIESTWPPLSDGSRKAKKLSHLIDEIADHLPLHTAAMHLLRDHGNEYLHPKRSSVSKESLFQRQRAARDVVVCLIEVIEAIYLAQREA